MEYAILYNPLAGGGRCTEQSQRLRTLLAPHGCTFYDLTKLKSYQELFAALAADAAIVLCGGDGTLNRFVNDTDGLTLPCPVYYYAAGSGNDFLRDIGGTADDRPVQIDRYLCNLPRVIVNGRVQRFLNGVGYGIDGYCCEEGDALREHGKKNINYTTIAVKGLLFHYRPTGATVTVDGAAHRYQHVWLAPTMHGRFYGGGMMPAPQQDRLNADGTVSVMVYHCRSKLKTLCVFPSIFKGGHVRHSEMVEILCGHDICVAFDRPTPLQIDGETIRNVTQYRVMSHGELCSFGENYSTDPSLYSSK